VSRARFSAEDLEAIRAATARAEAGSGAEIVPYIVARVDAHEESRWRWAALGVLAAVVVAGGVYAAGEPWPRSVLAWITAPAAIGMLLGLALARIPALERLLLGRDTVERRVRMRAEAAFLEEGVFRTRDRTGILLLIASFEHRAVLLADEGIDRVVQPGVWKEIVDELVEGIRDGRATEAVVAAIDRCGAILAAHVARHEDDRDELPDAPRERER
jgi:putative membrane protein